MPRRRPLTVALAAGLLTLATTARAAPATAPGERPVPELIRALGDADPAARAAAGAELVKRASPEAREALRQAAAGGEDPQVQAEAAALLRGLPLARPDDPPLLHGLLARFDALPHRQARLQFINGLAGDGNRGAAALPAPLANRALRRILADADDEPVRWAALRRLRGRDSGAPGESAALRQLAPPAVDDPQAENVPLLVGTGWAWAGHDSRRMAGLLRRAVDAQWARRAPLNGELGRAIDFLAENAFASRDYTTALELRRRAIVLSGRRRSVLPAELERWGEPDPVAELLAVHAGARGGPLPGFAADVRGMTGGELARATTLYALARWLDARGAGPAAVGVAAAAGWMGPAASDYRLAVGTFLADHGWDGYAAAEFRQAISLEPVSALNARFALYQLAERRHDHAEAAAQLGAIFGQAPDIVVTARGRRGDAPDAARDALWARLHLHAHKAAARSGDAAAAAKHLDELVRLEPSDSEVVLEAVPILKALGRAEDASKLFDRGYALSKGQLDREPDSPEMMNNLAWLCARSGERLHEAVALSQRAIAADPANYAYLDTAAEAKFRAGDAAEAVRLEERALQLRPDDAFMKEQLERFRAGL